MLALLGFATVVLLLGAIELAERGQLDYLVPRLRPSPGRTDAEGARALPRGRGDEFGWSMEDWARLGRGTLVGHLLECAGQVTDGYFADPGAKEVPDLARLGFPIGEVDDDGSLVVTRVEGSGGRVCAAICREQLLYEIDDLARYMALDVIAPRRGHALTRARRPRQEPQLRAPGPGAAGVTPRSAGGLLLAALVLWSTSAGAGATRLEITSREPMNGGKEVGAAGPFELLRGRIHGEVDPLDPHDRIIQDLALAPRNPRGKVEYVATFALAKPVDMARSSRVLLYQVVNRGNGQAVASPEGHVSLVSGWQGDVVPTAGNQTIAVPIARQKDGSPITGRVLARFVDEPDGASTAPIRLASLGTPQPYPPADLAEPQAALTWHAAETYDGAQTASQAVPRAAWAFADCTATPWPGKPDPSRVCLADGFRAGRIYELVYTARDPLVLGLGLAATRDIVSFFRYDTQDAAGTPNPVARTIDHAIAVGDSQSGNLIRTFIHLGFNQDERNRIVWDGAFPRIAARQTPMNLRFALPGGAAGRYEPGSEGVVWWARYEDELRGLKAASLLDRCTATKTCPRVIEAFGSAEFWGLRMSPDLVGTDARRDVPLPDNVRRYYYPGTTHGGGRGGFPIDASAPSGSRCTLPDNPNPEADQTRALTRALVEWVTKGTPPPASRYPTLANGDLVPATRAAIGLPDVPGLPFDERVLNPVVRHDFGEGFDPADVSGVMSVVPPRILGVVPTLVPRVDADGNETAGVPSVQLQAPLGTYLGWNTVRSGSFAGQGCGFQGGWIPFAKTKAERLANHDPRLSLEERYGTHEAYVARVRRAAEEAVRDRFLLPEDASRIIGEAETSDVLRR